MAALMTASDLVIDRFYRGAIVMTGADVLVIPEAAVALVEKVLRAPAAYQPEGEHERALASVLLARRILVEAVE